MNHLRGDTRRRCSIQQDALSLNDLLYRLFKQFSSSEFVTQIQQYWVDRVPTISTKERTKGAVYASVLAATPTGMREY